MVASGNKLVEGAHLHLTTHLYCSSTNSLDLWAKQKRKQSGDESGWARALLLLQYWEGMKLEISFFFSLELPEQITPFSFIKVRQSESWKKKKFRLGGSPLGKGECQEWAK